MAVANCHTEAKCARYSSPASRLAQCHPPHVGRGSLPRQYIATLGQGHQTVPQQWCFVRFSKSIKL